MVDAVHSGTSTESSEASDRAGTEAKSLSQKEKYHEIFYSYGMECRMHQGQKIRGVLKTIPADFIVTEIDKKGELVTVNKDCPILDPPINNQTSNEQVSPVPSPPVEEDIDDDYDDANPLAEKQMSELSDLSRKLEEMPDDDISILSEIVDLGCYDNKKVRARIHKSIKDNFPLLMGRTIHNEEDIQQITAFPDPSYPRLLPLLGKEETTKLLYYTKSSDPTENKSHFIPCDHHSKEHRAQIHRLIDELFGIFLVTRTVDVSVEKKRNRKRPRNHEESINSSNICVESTVSSSGSSDTAVSGSSDTAVSISGSGDTAVSISGSSDTAVCSSGSSDTAVSSSRSSDTAVSSSGSSDIAVSSSGSSDIAVSSGSGSFGKRIAVSFKAKIRKSAKRRKMGCPVIYDPNYFTSFSLKKENFETFLTILKLADSLCVDPSRFAIAGSKDKKAITYQKMTARNISMARLSAINIPGIELGSFEYVPYHLNLGDHQGNRFQIRVRKVETTTDEKDSLEDIIKVGCKSLEEKGFINYFGVQRFGRMIDPHPLNGPLVGYYMILDDPLNAIRAMFSPASSVNPGAKEAKEYFTRTGDVEGTIHRMPEVPRELMILKNLNKYGMSKFGCEKSLLGLPHQSRRLYVSSFTSLLWNHMASYRIREYGTEPVEGDLVLVNDGLTKLSGQTVRTITSEHISSRQYSLKDVVLPVCGYRSVMPNNRVGDRLKELLAALSLSLLSFRSFRYSNNLFGTYRKLINYPHDLTWRLSKAPSFTASLPPPPTAATKMNVPGVFLEEGGSSGSPESDGPSDSMSCLEMEFNLDPGNYVTTMMNEILS